jgi:UDP-N-acetylmuramate--alanine ligase
VENEGVKEILPKINSPVITYGFNPKADIVAVNVDSNEHGTSFDVGFKGDNLGRFELRLFGKHNVLNSLAAIGVAKELRIDNETIRHALSRFSGAERRFQLLYDGNVKIVDDYAHHPTEIRATIDAARSLASGRIISVFQPHLFTRTRDFYKEFAKALSETDVIVVLDVYPAREEPLPGITGELIAEELKRLGKDNVYFMAEKRKLPSLLRKIIRDGDLIIAMGAGDITALIHEFAEEMKRTEESK